MRARVLPLLSASLLTVPARIHAQPRPIASAERGALILVAEFLAADSSVFYDALTRDSDFRRLPEAKVRAELDARVGPPGGTIWKLQTTGSGKSKRYDESDVAFQVRFPSGLEEGVLFRMKYVGTRWGIHDILVLTEPARGTAPRLAAAERAEMLKIGAFATTALCLLLALALSRFRVARRMLILTSLLAFSAAMVPLLAPEPTTQLLDEYFAPTPFVQLHELAPLRRALARSAMAPPSGSISDDARSVATLWMVLSGRSQSAGTNGQPVIGAAAATPAGEFLRGFMSQEKDDPIHAEQAFDAALRTTHPQRDDVLLSTAMASRDPERRMRTLDQLIRMGSRDAITYYALAALALNAGGYDSTVGELFEIAWQLEPLPREELARHLALARYVTTKTMLHPQEPDVIADDLGRDPLDLPPGAKSYVCGKALRVVIGDARIEIPNGARLASTSAAKVAPTEWHRLRQSEDLRDAHRLLAKPALIAAPAMASRLSAAAAALARHNRWADLLRLTDGLDSDHLIGNPELLDARVLALIRQDRLEDARELVTGPIVKKLIAQKNSPDVMLSLGDAMVHAREFEIAEQLYRGVDARQFGDVTARRLGTVTIRRKLSEGGLTFATRHFDIRHDATVKAGVPERLGIALEAVLPQLEAALPASPFRRIAINVVSTDTYGYLAGNPHVAAFYDGEVVLPYRDGDEQDPHFIIVATHEMTHAMVALATRDNAPRWFQEGFAQYAEPQRFSNEFPYLPLELLDAFTSSDHPAVMATGYRAARHFVRFLDVTYPEAVKNLIRAFADGKTTDQALQSVTGTTIETLNLQFYDWYQSAPSRPLATPFIVAPAVLPPATAAPETAPANKSLEIRWTRAPGENPRP